MRPVPPLADAIQEHLFNHRDGLSAAELASQLGSDVAAVRAALESALDAGFVGRCPPTTDSSGNSVERFVTLLRFRPPASRRRRTACALGASVAIATLVVAVAQLVVPEKLREKAWGIGGPDPAGQGYRSDVRLPTPGPAPTRDGGTAAPTTPPQRHATDPELIRFAQGLLAATDPPPRVKP